MDRKEILKEILKNFPNHKCIPSKELHKIRNDYNVNVTGHTFVFEEPNMYKDINTGFKWTVMPWWLNIFHNPIKNIKLVLPDTMFLNEAQSSSEIIIPKKDILNKDENKIIQISESFKKSFNFRDLLITSRISHFFADVFPNIIFGN